MSNKQKTDTLDNNQGMFSNENLIRIKKFIKISNYFKNS